MDDTLNISAIQHYAYCPRQFALIHVEQVWDDNRFTAEGLLLHRRVDGGEPEQRRHVRYERTVLLKSERLGLIGKMDLLEIDTSNGYRLIPVEYKRGRSKTQDWDRLQLCAQALCLEEMRHVEIEEGAIWYWETRRREEVRFDTALRARTEAIIVNALDLIRNGTTPPPTEDCKRCKACSLYELCQPDALRQDHSAAYIRDLFQP